MITKRNLTRLDAAESTFFSRELESIDKKVYARKYPELIGRSLVPKVADVDEADLTYTYREVDYVGTTAAISDYSQNLPRVQVLGREFSHPIRLFGTSAQWSIMEVKHSAKVGRPLSPQLLMANRSVFERDIDEMVAIGHAPTGLKGLLNQGSIATFTLGTKVAGGLTWGTIALPNATGPEMAADILGIAADLVEGSKGVIGRARILIPLEQYNLAAVTKMSATGEETVLSYVKRVAQDADNGSGIIESIRSWWRCKGAGAGATNRMVAYDPNEDHLGLILPMEFNMQPPQDQNLAKVVNCIGSCGGVVVRYRIAVRYADGL